jgi:DNA-binding response OmpR family regulator
MAMNILVADDDKVHVHLLTNLLKKRGFGVTIAYDGLQAWSTALRMKPDAILLDIHMPAGTGFEVLRKLKSSTKTSQIPVIVVSGSVNADEVVTIEMLGADEFVRKPADLDHLFERLRAVLNATRTADEVI